MPYAIIHHFPNSSLAQYGASIAAVHPDPNSLLPGQIIHTAGKSEKVMHVLVVYDTKANYEAFRDNVLMPALMAGI